MTLNGNVEQTSKVILGLAFLGGIGVYLLQFAGVIQGATVKTQPINDQQVTAFVEMRREVGNIHAKLDRNNPNSIPVLLDKMVILDEKLVELLETLTEKYSADLTTREAQALRSSDR